MEANAACLPVHPVIRRSCCSCVPGCAPLHCCECIAVVCCFHSCAPMHCCEHLDAVCCVLFASLCNHALLSHLLSNGPKHYLRACCGLIHRWCRTSETTGLINQGNTVSLSELEICTCISSLLKTNLPRTCLSSCKASDGREGI